MSLRTTAGPLSRPGPVVPAGVPSGVLGAVLCVLYALFASKASAQPPLLFFDDFEDPGLAAWSFPHGAGHRRIDTGDPERGHALELRTVSRPVFALIRGSERWEGVRVEGLARFPEAVDNYLGLIYRYRDDGRRIDFGSLYIKGNGSYVRVNPHFDTNVGRTLYEELRTPLRGPAAVEVGRWTPFALEVVGSEAHLWVGRADAPSVTFPFYQGAEGGFGVKPRNPGGAVWIDDVTVRTLDAFTWTGPPRPNVAYAPELLLTRWDVLGPLVSNRPEVEDGPFEPDRTLNDDGRTVGWRPFDTDGRGAVVTGRVTETRGRRRVAYFHTAIHRAAAGEAELLLSSVDDLAIWLNGHFLGFAPGGANAWWDVGSNPEHPGVRAHLTLREGANHLVIRVVGGVYATGGFFARLEPAGPAGR